MSIIAVQFVKMVTATVLLSVFFLSGASADCILRPTLRITAPREMEALSGSCLQIPCDFSAVPGPYEPFNSARTTFGVWIKSDFRFGHNSSYVVFNSSGAATYPMNITGDLSQRNCTTLFSSLITNYTDRYYFRIENRQFLGEAICDPLNITVNDSPPKPRIEISGDLKEKQSVTVTCSASTPCPHSPPKLTWSLQQDPLHIREENTDRTLTTKIQKTLILSDKHDGFSITCSAGYPVNEGKDVKTTEERMTLGVSYPPKDTSVVISPTDPVSVGSMVNLTCSCRGNPPAVSHVWFMSDGRLELIKTETQVYGFRVTSSDRGRLYYCGCRNDLDLQLSTGRQLIFEGDQQSEVVGVEVIVKTLGIVMLVSTLVIFECWFRSRRSTKQVKEAVEADYVNTGAELQPR